MSCSISFLSYFILVAIGFQSFCPITCFVHFSSVHPARKIKSRKQKNHAGCLIVELSYISEKSISAILTRVYVLYLEGMSEAATAPPHSLSPQAYPTGGVKLYAVMGNQKLN